MAIRIEKMMRIDGSWSRCQHFQAPMMLSPWTNLQVDRPWAGPPKGQRDACWGFQHLQVEPACWWICHWCLVAIKCDKMWYSHLQKLFFLASGPQSHHSSGRNLSGCWAKCLWFHVYALWLGGQTFGACCWAAIHELRSYGNSRLNGEHWGATKSFPSTW